MNLLYLGLAIAFVGLLMWHAGCVMEFCGQIEDEIVDGLQEYGPMTTIGLHMLIADKCSIPRLYMILDKMEKRGVVHLQSRPARPAHFDQRKGRPEMWVSLTT